MVSINDTNNRNTELSGFCNRAFLIAHIDDK